MSRIAQYALFFFFYSLIGWVFESIVCSIFAHKWINRGFLTGPMCPIYGGGVLTMLVALGPIAHHPLVVEWFGRPFSLAPLFVALGGMIACDALEFITSFTMEKLFHARWWDYTNKPFNLDGRICLGHTMIWGVASIGVTYIFHPLTEKLFALVPDSLLRIALVAVLVLFVLDLLQAVKSAADIRKIMDKIGALQSKLENWVIPERVSGEKVTKTVRDAEDFVHQQTAALEGYSRGAHLKAKARGTVERIRHHVAQIFYGYPAMQKITVNALQELSRLLGEVAKRLFADEENMF
ncbi:MAG: putative ABC transporter permease [Oscillospiraceae bacterium]|jgi:uncharacterized membrane protein|nr:putative ABC transporter permease [Oscillospiraceae bacterium]